MKRYRLVPSRDFVRRMKKLDKPVQRQVKAYMEQVAKLEDPRIRGKALVGNHAGQWRYRVGNYRVICEIQDDKLVILAITVGHRRDIY